jgi:micrococcal nuclease
VGITPATSLERLRRRRTRSENRRSRWPAARSACAVTVLLAAVVTAPLLAQRPVDLVNLQLTGRVVGIVDGDTVDVLVHPNRKVRVRIHGVDAPERNEPFSQQALSFTRVFMFSRDVTLMGRDIDPYDRLVARIVVDGADASAAMLSAGLACHFRRYSDDPILEAAEQAARTSRRGFWAPGALQPACVGREARVQATAASRQPSPAATGLVGNVNSRVFHAPACVNANCKNCTRRFATRAEAEAAGFRPAGDCLR